LAKSNGWQGDDYRTFIYGTEAISGAADAEEEWVYPGGEELPSKGTLEGWQRHVAEQARGNAQLIFEISQNFAGPLLKPLGAEGGGVHTHKGTSKGKSTSTYVGASVHGGPSYVVAWDSSPAYLYSKSQQRNDLSLPLDEIDLATNKDWLSKGIYAIANGSAPGRGTASGGVRERGEPWRVTMPSNGEKSPSQRLQELGGKATGGIEVRLANCPWRGLTNYHEHGTDGAAFADAIKQAAAKYYGTAGREFVRNIVADPEPIFDKARRLVKTLTDKLAPVGSDGAEVRVARRFAIFAAAGELAIEFGIVPWRKGSAIGAAMVNYRRWIGDRGGRGSTEVLKGRRALMCNLITYGSANFGVVRSPRGKSPSDILDDAADLSDTESFIHMRRGFKRRIDGGTEYWMADADFAFMCDNHDPDGVREQLAKEGIVLRDRKNLKAKRNLPGIGRTRVTVVLLADNVTDNT
jgi:putative DNA primase/helicase